MNEMVFVLDKDLLRDPEEGSDGKQKQKPTDPSSSSSFRKTPTFSDKKPDIISGSRRFSEPEKPAALLPSPTPRPPTPPISRKPSTSTAPTEAIKTNPSNPTQTEADLWEKAEMAKIKDKYSIILLPFSSF